MKKLYLFLCLSLFASSLTAAGPFKGNAQSAERFRTEKNGKTVGNLKLVESNKQITKKTPIAKAPIATPPAGETKNYLRSAFYYYTVMGASIGMYQTDEYSTEIIFADNNEVYFKNPMSDSDVIFQTYMKGVVDGNKITVTLPQEIFVDEEGNSYNVDRLKFVITDEVEQSGIYMPDAEKRTLEYTIEADGTIVMEESWPFSNDVTNPDMILGLTDSKNNWCGYGDWDQVYHPFAETPTLMPEGANVENYLMRSNQCAARTVGFYMDGTDVYINNWLEDFPESCVKGELKGDKVIFPCHQYLGVSLEFAGPSYMWGSNYVWVTDDPILGEGWGMQPIEEIVFDYDAETKTLTTEDTLIINLYDSEICYLDIYDGPTIRPFRENPEYTSPEKPIIVSVQEYNPEPEYGYGSVGFLLSQFDLNGNVLDSDRMYYNIMFGGEKYTFDPSLYIELKEPVTDLAYTFTDTPYYNGYDIKVMGISHKIYFYERTLDLTKVQIQLFYKDENGKVYASEVTCNDPSDPGSVEGVNVTKQVVETFYTDLCGVRVVDPEKGLYIKTEVYSDGTTKSTKQIMY